MCGTHRNEWMTEWRDRPSCIVPSTCEIEDPKSQAIILRITKPLRKSHSSVCRTVECAPIELNCETDKWAELSWGKWLNRRAEEQQQPKYYCSRRNNHLLLDSASLALPFHTYSINSRKIPRMCVRFDWVETEEEAFCVNPVPLIYENDNQGTSCVSGIKISIPVNNARVLLRWRNDSGWGWWAAQRGNPLTASSTNKHQSREFGEWAMDIIGVRERILSGLVCLQILTTKSRKYFNIVNGMFVIFDEFI